MNFRLISQVRVNHMGDDDGYVSLGMHLHEALLDGVLPRANARLR